MVLNVNMLSLRKNHVNNGKTINPVTDPINLADQTESKALVVNFHAYQNKTLVGMPNTTADIRGLFDHHLLRYWLFNWNQPRTCPPQNNVRPSIKVL